MRDFFLNFVPAVIAIALVATLIYLLVFQPGQKIPDVLAGAITLILGYYFGRTAASAESSKPTFRTAEELREGLQALLVETEQK